MKQLRILSAPEMLCAASPLLFLIQAVLFSSLKIYRYIRVCAISSIFPCSMSVFDYIQTSSIQKFLQSQFVALYLGTSYIYMPLASAIITFLSLVLYILSKHFFWNSPNTAGKYASVQKVCTF